MKRKPSTAPVVDSPWAASILPSTSKRSPTHSAASTPSAADAPTVPAPPAAAATPVSATPTWSPEAAAPIESSLVSAAPAQFAPPQYAPPAQFAQPRFGPPAQFGPPQGAPPPQFAPPQFGPPAQFGPPQGAPTPQFAPPPQFGGSPQFGAPAQFGSPPQPYAYQLAPVTKGRSTVGIVLGIVGGVVLALVLAAIAIPVFLSHHQKAANRNVVLPQVLLGQPRLAKPDADGSVAAEIANLQQSSPGMTQTQAAFYGSADQGIFMVVAGKLPRRPTSADEKSFFSLSPAKGNLTLSRVGSGPFGGSMECGQQTSGGQTFIGCESLDNAAAVLVVASNTTPNQLALLTREIIGAIEQKG